MKFYGNKKTGKLLVANKHWGLKEVLLNMGFEDVLGNSYAGSLYSIWRIKEGDTYRFARITNSPKKRLRLKKEGWEEIKMYGTNEVPKEFLEEVTVNE
ncbi:hypothetical protein KK120_18755 [Virgibacillus dakarensis]|nr:hypothetical protein [Virgibacillus dakarensis]